MDNAGAHAASVPSGASILRAVRRAATLWPTCTNNTEGGQSGEQRSLEAHGKETYEDGLSGLNVPSSKYRCKTLFGQRRNDTATEDVINVERQLVQGYSATYEATSVQTRKRSRTSKTRHKIYSTVE
ncbi:uncharacterized protein LOC112588474 [Harpegnathos saltator]|uniref:uncharacterized protein LOC112588474 n=1 Tax=Harpegnathos saltator TaxID=610380 RepID=UPI000DBEEBFA|nr:uncharacterized protein LOC112588474 [Harpegnathos saltator]